MNHPLQNYHYTIIQLFVVGKIFFLMLLKEVSYAPQGCIYVMKMYVYFDMF